MVKNKDTPKPHTNKLSVFEKFLRVLREKD